MSFNNNLLFPSLDNNVRTHIIIIFSIQIVFTECVMLFVTLALVLRKLNSVVHNIQASSFFYFFFSDVAAFD